MGYRWITCKHCSERYWASSSKTVVCADCKEDLGLGKHAPNDLSECFACGNKYPAQSQTQKFCKTCIPNHAWYNIYKRYDLTKPMYDDLLVKQNNECPLCLRQLKGIGRIHVDHCHETGDIRGILCSRCNTTLELFENPEFVARVFQYLNKNRK